jgi:hypothetical protein
MRITPSSAFGRTMTPLRPARPGNVYQPVTRYPIPTMAAGNPAARLDLVR